ncbi:MAG: hypothetical protein Q9M35_02465 [Rhodothermus sp.]|nr:hypothetical protein [Rhodothermus sp.]
MASLKELIFNKGGIGKSLSRQETVERINPLIREHIALNHQHDYVIRTIDNAELADRLEQFQKIARVDVGKLAEVVFSAGGTAYSGVDMEPDDFNLGTDPAEMIHRLLQAEQHFLQLVAEELKLNHQIRTKATLNLVRQHSEERLRYLQKVARRYPKPASATAS